MCHHWIPLMQAFQNMPYNKSVHAAFERQLYERSGVHDLHNLPIAHTYGCLAIRLSADCLGELSAIR